MRRAARTALTVCALGPGLAAVLALGACGTAGPAGTTTAGPSATSAPAPAPGSTGSGPGASSPGTPADAALTFCREVRANGGTGASFGPIPTFYRKKPLLADVRDKLAAMGTLTPPAEIGKPWALQKRTLRRVEAAAGKLKSDQALGELPEVDPKDFHGGAIDEAQDTLTDYYFAHCR